jgi:hypothetical protein
MGLTSDEKRAFGDSKRRNTPLKKWAQPSNEKRGFYVSK